MSIHINLGYLTYFDRYGIVKETKFIIYRNYN